MNSLNVGKASKYVIGAGTLVLFAISCAGSNSSSPSAAPKAVAAVGAVSGLSATAQQSILGNYTGLLKDNGDDSQEYSLTLSQAPAAAAGSQAGLSMLLTSNGNAFSGVNDSEVVNFDPAGNLSAKGETQYVFYSGVHEIPGLSNTAVQLEIDIVLNAANQVDSSQSQIHIWDCGYGTTCNDTAYSEASFVGLAKH
jgi:hypothetical protein